MRQSKQQTSLFDTMDTQESPFKAVQEENAAIINLNGNPEPAAILETSKLARTKKQTVKSHSRGDELTVIHQNLVSGLRKFFEERDYKRGVVGVSGGIDSALTLKIAVDALGAENVTALLMPELGLTKQENIDHAKLLCQYFAVNCFYQPINSFVTDFTVMSWKPSPLAHMNTKARIRAALLYNYANSERAMVLGTSNKSEILLGYGTKYGDLAADVEVIGELYKTEVWKLAEHLGFPSELVHKTPSAELTQGQSDEEDIGATYADMDNVLAKLDAGRTACMEHGLSPALVNMVFRRVEENMHKREMPPVLKAR